jgi:KDO2-lipid IV(A) lauroyltransferase
MMLPVLRLAARLPLGWLHRAGAVLGWLAYWLSPVYARHLRENLHASGVCADAPTCRTLVRQVVGETGKGVTELIAIWFGEQHKMSALVACDTWSVAEQALREGSGVIFLTPHLGCFEAAGLYLAQRMPLTVMYRPPKLKWLEPLMIAGRARWQAKLAPAQLRGVRMLYKALKDGQAVGLLPDQTPGVGEGVWSAFFGRPAYTMTLVSRLQRATGAAMVLTYAERLPAGRGFQLHFQRMPTANLDEAAVNRAVEGLIRRCPAQYLWGYNRFKVPAGVTATEMRTDEP